MGITSLCSLLCHQRKHYSFSMLVDSLGSKLKVEFTGLQSECWLQCSFQTGISIGRKDWGHGFISVLLTVMSQGSAQCLVHSRYWIHSCSIKMVYSLDNLHRLSITMKTLYTLPLNVVFSLRRRPSSSPSLPPSHPSGLMLNPTSFVLVSQKDLLLNVLCCSSIYKELSHISLFIWKSNVFCSAEQPRYSKYLLRQIKWFCVAVLKSLISMCRIMFIIIQIQRHKIAHLHW